MTDPNINVSETFKPKAHEAGSSKQSLKKQNNKPDFDETLKNSQKKIFESSLPWGQLQAIFQMKFDYRPDFSFDKKVNESLSRNNATLIDAASKSNSGNFDSDQKGMYSRLGSSDIKEAKNPVQELAAMMPANKSVNPNFTVFLPFNELVRNMSKFTNRLEIKIIADKIIERARALKAGETTELIIDLKPEWLGNITLSISSEKGHINVAIYAGESAKALLDSNIAELQDSLKSANLNIGAIQVSVGGRQDSGNSGDNASDSGPRAEAQNFAPLRIRLGQTNPSVYNDALSYYNKGYKIFSQI